MKNKSGSIVRSGARCILGLCLILLSSCGGGSDQGSAAAAQSGDSAISPAKLAEALAAAEQNLRLARFNRAEAILTELVEKAPDNAEARELLGQTLFQRGAKLQGNGETAKANEFFVSAFEQYRILTELRPDVAGFHQSAGEMANMAGRRGAALDHFRTAGRLDPANPKHPLFEAQILLAEERTDEAMRAIQRALAMNPHQPYALATEALILLEQGRNDEAFERIAESRRNADQTSERAVRLIEARMHRQAGRPERALQLLLPLDAAERAELTITVEVAAALEAMGDWRRVEDAWANRFRHTGEARAPIEAGIAAAKAGEYADARAWRQQAVLRGATTDVLAELDALLSADRNSKGDGG